MSHDEVQFSNYHHWQATALETAIQLALWYSQIPKSFDGLEEADRCLQWHNVLNDQPMANLHATQASRLKYPLSKAAE